MDYETMDSERYWQDRAANAENLLNELAMYVAEMLEDQLDEEGDNILARSIEFINTVED